MSDPFAALRDGLTPECLSDFTLDRLQNDELTPEEAARAQAHLQGCGRCQAQRLALQRPMLEGAELPLLAARARRAAEQAPASKVVSFGRRLAPLAIAAGLTAVVAALFWKPAEPSLQAKGGDSLSLVVKRRDGRLERVTQGATLFAHEQVRFSLDLSTEAFALVLSLDAEGKVSSFTPEPVALHAGAEQLLETTVELDASEGAERFFAVLCAQPRPASELLAVAERALRRENNEPARVLGLDSGCREASLLVRKQR